VYSFFEKLQKDDTAPGLHIEPMHTPADPRVRTGRIDLNYRGVLFKVAFDAIPHYFYYGAWPHDEAIDIARSSVLQVNSVNGVLEVIRASAPDGHTPPVLRVPPVAPVVPDAQESGVEAQVPEDEHGARQEETPEVWINPLLGCGMDPAELVSELGLAADLVGRAFAASSDEELLDVLDEAPEWQATALLELAAGTSVQEVQDKLALSRYLDDPQSTEEEKIRKSLEHPATRMQFTFGVTTRTSSKRSSKVETSIPGARSSIRNSVSIRNVITTAPFVSLEVPARARPWSFSTARGGWRRLNRRRGLL
jgi:hypothetical protein